jgi:hypothetical protein
MTEPGVRGGRRVVFVKGCSGVKKGVRVRVDGDVVVAVALRV